MQQRWPICYYIYVYIKKALSWKKVFAFGLTVYRCHSRSGKQTATTMETKLLTRMQRQSVLKIWPNLRNEKLVPTAVAKVPSKPFSDST